MFNFKVLPVRTSCKVAIIMARKENELKTSSDTQKRIAAGPEGRHFGDVACAFPTCAVHGCKTNQVREC